MGIGSLEPESQPFMAGPSTLTAKRQNNKKVVHNFTQNTKFKSLPKPQ